jgi:BirA family biotin operon repressor/biotin-[acetyl-CoA-carboxylase] ligase
MVFTNRNRLDSIREGLAAHVENLVLFEVTGSTHTLARTLIADMDEEDQNLGSTLILADRQDNGEGRGDRHWESPPGGLYMSWLRSGLTAETIAQLPMLAATAVHTAVTHIGVPNARIKWPNDILVKGRKLGGLLVFARHGETSWVTVGLGVNLESAPVIVNDHAILATSVADHVADGDLESWRHDIVCTFVTALDQSMADPKPAIDLWRSLLIQQPGDSIVVRLASGMVVSGTLVGISEEGFLRIRTNGKERVITGGDIIES